MIHCGCQVVGVVLANALMHSIIHRAPSQPDERDGLQPAYELSVRWTNSEDDGKADLL